MSKNLRGFVLYNGPSKLTGEPIVAIATMESTNAKTGNMVQTWIMRSDMAPLEALKAKADGAVCGGCPHRRSIGGACYVNVGQAPQGVWKAFKRGAYPTATETHLDSLNGRKIRLGSYGDPAAVPFEVWQMVTWKAAGWTGYTHQSAHPNFDVRILGLCMLSVDTPRSAEAYQSKGFRTFRVKTVEAPMLPGETECLAEASGLTCMQCGICNGAQGGGAPSVVINVHGSLANRYVVKFAKANVAGVQA